MAVDLMRAVFCAPPAVMLNYLVFNMAGVGITYANLCQVFERRRRPLVLWTYFFVKGIVDVNLRYAISYGPQTAEIDALNRLWTFVTAFASLAVVLYTFRGDYVQVGLCALLSDMAAVIVVSLALALGNMWAGEPLDTGYLVPASSRTLIYVGATFAMGRLLMMPLAWILRYLGQVVLRHRGVWAGVLLAFLLSVASTMGGAVYTVAYLDSSSYVYLPFMSAVVATLLLLLMMRRRDIESRRKTLARCLSLARSYDQTVRSQLAALDCDRSVLDGHETSLRKLGGGTADSELSGRIAVLERSFRRLSAGNYCDQPALDAVLTSCAGRLRARGVEPTFTVAGVPAHKMVPAVTALTLLNLAMEAAERTSSVEGSQLELRVRGVGEQLLFRLDVPARWGHLGAWRFLAPLTRRGTMVVRERRRGARTLVLVVEEAQDA